MLKLFFRSSSLTLVSAVLALCAAALVLWPRALVHKALPLPVPEGDQEVVWLYAATNNSAWERLVSAVSTATRQLQTDRPNLGLEVDDHNAFPPHTTAIPELILSVQGTDARLHLRWYKLTSDLKTRDWVEALVQRKPAPLAIIGGSSSDMAIDLATQLHEAPLPPDVAAPLLLLTMATADEVQTPDGSRMPLNAIHGERTFRFCFTNRQMAEAVTNFIWSQDDLRPDADPVYVAFWEDDPYSVDLTDRFCESLRHAAVLDWIPPTPERIPFSVGSFNQPNRWEVEAARDLIDKLGQRPMQKRPLLIVPASSQPARRFLRGLERVAPVASRRFVVATGDGIAFNSLYRDRNLTWPIQDLPFPLVAFCHRNPVDARAGFLPEADPQSANPNEGAPTTGTEDLLLYVDVVVALTRAAFQHRQLAADADELGQRLRLARMNEQGQVSFHQGQPLFDSLGNRNSGTGEHVVCLRPRIEGERVQSSANISVWAWRSEEAPGGRWHLSRELLQVDYDNLSGD